MEQFLLLSDDIIAYAVFFYNIHINIFLLKGENKYPYLLWDFSIMTMAGYFSIINFLLFYIYSFVINLKFLAIRY